MPVHDNDAPVIVVGGPTASGKSTLALALAEALNGVVVNADSMQVYAELSVLTARPGPDALARAPHLLYGVLPASQPCSAALWREMAVGEIEAAHRSGRRAIVAGGTGLYLRALMEGLAPVPPVPGEIRAAAIAAHDRLGAAAFHARLAERDAETAERLGPGDRQRMIRAWEVLEATGVPLSHWQRQPAGTPAFGFACIVLRPPRDPLYAACDARFLRMIEDGALDEVRSLAALRLDPDLPAMKALGVPDLLAHLRGEITLDEAIARSQQATRNYAKRQTTWFRHQLGPDRAPAAARVKMVHAQFSETMVPQLINFVRQKL